jgi:DNA repair protein RadC
MKYQQTFLNLPTNTVRENGSNIRTPKDIAEFCSDMKNLCQETLQILTLNARNKLIDRHLISLGSTSQTIVHPRDIFRACINDNATCFILIHNHPSGDTTPSAEDIKITKQVIEAGKIMDISCIDHIIIAKETGPDKAYLSLRESQLITF